MTRFLRRTSLFAALLSLHAFLAPSAHADIVRLVDPTSNMLSWAKGVALGDELYDVRFVQGASCATVYAGCASFSPSSFTFTTQQSANDAARALLEQVFVDDLSSGKLWDSNIALTCGNARYCNAAVPYGFELNAQGQPYGVNFRSVLNQPGTASGNSNRYVSGYRGIGPSSVFSDTVYTVWTLAEPEPVQEVPEPTTAALVLLALIGCAGALRPGHMVHRKRSQAMLSRLH
ncbi:hypothetical protein [Pseudorhodoferax aquiterrae]|nr:hypothetical protein [Pseudorhodoferax aquiterrae]